MNQKRQLGTRCKRNALATSVSICTGGPCDLADFVPARSRRWAVERSSSIATGGRERILRTVAALCEVHQFVGGSTVGVFCRWKLDRIGGRVVGVIWRGLADR